MDGWIIIARAVTDHWIWNRPDYGFRWIDLILQANFAQTKTIVDSQVVTCERGELITTCERLSRRWRTSRSTVQRFLKLLEKEKMVCVVRAPRMTRITICNYETYQSLLARGGTKARLRRDKDGEYLLPSYAEVQMISAQTAHEAEMDTGNQGAGSDTHLKEGKKGKERNSRKEGGGAQSDTVSNDFVSFYLVAFNSRMEGKRIKPISSIHGERAMKLQDLERDHGRDNVLQAFSKAAASGFLNGANDKAWVASFDWIIDPKNFPKVLEGNYDGVFIEKPQKALASPAQERERRAAEEREREAEERRRKDEEEEKRRKSVDNIIYHYLRFGGEAWRQKAVEAGLDITELDRQREGKNNNS